MTPPPLPTVKIASPKIMGTSIKSAKNNNRFSEQTAGSKKNEFN